jgi:hypothetical protein
VMFTCTAHIFDKLEIGHCYAMKLKCIESETKDRYGLFKPTFVYDITTQQIIEGWR